MFRRVLSSRLSSRCRIGHETLYRNYATLNTGVIPFRDTQTTIHINNIPKITKRYKTDPGTNTQLEELKTSLNKTLTSKTNWSISDLLAVWTTATLFTLILVGPSVIREMKKSNDQYDLVDYSEDVSILTKQVLDYVHELHEEGEDKNVLVDGAADIVSKVLQTEVVQLSIQGLVVRALQSPEVRESSISLVRHLFKELIEDPDTLTQIIKVLHTAIQDPTIKQSLLNLIVELTHDESIKQSLQQLLVRLGKDPEVIYATQSLLTTSAHKTLQDPEVLDHSMEFAANIVGDDVVQRTSGEALRNAIRFSVTPDVHTLLTSAGIFLVVTSIYVFNTSPTPIPSFIKLHPYNLLQNTKLYLQTFIPSLPSSNTLYHTLILHPMKYSMSLLNNGICNVLTHGNDALLNFIPPSDVEGIIMPYIYPQQIVGVMVQGYDMSLSSVSLFVMEVNKLAKSNYQSLILLWNENMKERFKEYYEYIQSQSNEYYEYIQQQSVQSSTYITNVVYKYYHVLNDQCHKAAGKISKIGNKWSDHFRIYLVAVFHFISLWYYDLMGDE